MYYRRKFRSQTSDTMDRWKSRGEKSPGWEEKKWEDQRRERERRKKMQVHEKVGKSSIHCVFPMICGSGGSKSRLAKAAGAEPAGQMRDEKMHTIVAPSTFPSQNVQSTPTSDHFWKFRCRKSARCCGAKQISNSKYSKCTKHTNFGPLLEVEMSKKCMPLWREPRFQVKSVKKWRSQTTFWSWEVQKVHAVVARSAFGSQKCQWRSDVEKVHMD